MEFNLIDYTLKDLISLMEKDNYCLERVIINNKEVLIKLKNEIEN